MLALTPLARGSKFQHGFNLCHVRKATKNIAEIVCLHALFGSIFFIFLNAFYKPLLYICLLYILTFALRECALWIA